MFTDWNLDVFKDNANKVSDIFDVGYDIYHTISGRRAAHDEIARDTINAQQPTYQPNVSASDLAFQPNWYLLAGGAALLIAVAVISRK